MRNETEVIIHSWAQNDEKRNLDLKILKISLIKITVLILKQLNFYLTKSKSYCFMFFI